MLAHNTQITIRDIKNPTIIKRSFYRKTNARLTSLMTERLSRSKVGVGKGWCTANTDSISKVYRFERTVGPSSEKKANEGPTL